MFHTDIFSKVSGKRTRDIQACLKAYSLALELFDKYVSLPSALNVHYGSKVMNTGLMQLSMNGGYAESTMMDLRLRYGIETPCGSAFLYRMKMLNYDEWYSRLKSVNDAVLSSSATVTEEWLGLLKEPVICAIDYTKVPYYGKFNRYVTRSKRERGTNHFYEYATISIVQNGLRLCIYSRPVTLLDMKSKVVRELIEETQRRGVRIKLLLLDRAFFTVECINLLKELRLRFIMPCVCNERVKAAVASFGKEGRIISFSIHDSSKNEASFTMVVYWSREKGKYIPFATNIERTRTVKKLVRTIPKQYRMRWGIETSFRKIKEVFPMTTSPSPAIRLAYFMVAMILYNLWQLVNIMLDTGDEEKKTGRYHVTIPFMITVLCAHLNGRL